MGLEGKMVLLLHELRSRGVPLFHKETQGGSVLENRTGKAMRLHDRAARNDLIERLLDVPLALVLLIFVAPLMAVVALMILVQDRGPVLFGQSRIGRDGRSFKCLKFRSMVVDAEARLDALLAGDPQARAHWDSDYKLRNDPRVTRLGAFLRRSSLDELPQLINVLRGEMNVVTGDGGGE